MPIIKEDISNSLVVYVGNSKFKTLRKYLKSIELTKCEDL